MPSHRSNPAVFPSGTNRYIGASPWFGGQHYEAWKYAMHWVCQQGQLLTFTGPGPYAIPGATDHMYDNPDYDHDGVSPWLGVIMHAAPKADTSNPRRKLGGLLVPWRYAVEKDSGDSYITGIPRVTWTENSVTRTLWQMPKSSANYESISAARRDLEEIALYTRWVDISHGDNNCERDDTDYWDSGAASGTCTLSKAGSAGVQYLRVAETDISSVNPYAQWPADGTLPAMHDGSEYRLRAEVRGDGNGTPRFEGSGGTVIWTGTDSSDWQEVNEKFTLDGDYIRLTCVSGPGENVDHVDCQYMFLSENGRFDYTPDSGGGFEWGKIAYERMMVAGLGIFTLPDFKLTDDQLQLANDELRKGRAIRGYSGTGRESWGNLMYLLGDGQSDDTDDLERSSRKCVFQVGHPCGVAVNATSYENIRAGENSWFMVEPSALWGGDASDCVECKPAVIAKTQNGGSCDIKFTSSVGSDTSTATITDTDWTLIEPSDFDGTLTMYKNKELFKLELEAASNDAIAVKTISLWKDSEL